MNQMFVMRSRALSFALPLTLLMAGVVLRPAAAQEYNINNLDANSSANPAAFTDPNLVNAWGIASAPGGTFWIADTGTGFSTLYNGQTGAINSLVVTIPESAGGIAANDPTGSPVGIAFTGGGQGFTTSTFAFDTADGAIESWASGTTAVIRDDLSASGAVFRGLADASSGGNNFLYAADFHNNQIDVFNTSFAQTTLTGSFVDPNAVAGYAAFNIQAETIGGTQELFVAYALQNASKTNDAAGAGDGYIDEFNTNGTFVQRFATGSNITGGNSLLTSLNAPWGITLAPAAAGFFGGDLLVGNFGSGEIDAFNPTTGVFQGVFENGAGSPLVVRGLWALAYGTGGAGGTVNTLYFTSGPGGQTQGVFGSITAAPEPAPIALVALMLPIMFRRNMRRRFIIPR